MSEHPLNGMMNSAMENLKQIVDVDTIVGNPVTAPDGTVVIPVSKVSFGLFAGGCEFNSKKNPDDPKKPFGGAVGAGVSIDPVAFLVANDVQVKLLPVKETDPVAKLVDYIPSMVSKITELFPKKDKENNE